MFEPFAQVGAICRDQFIDGHNDTFVDCPPEVVVRWVEGDDLAEIASSLGRVHLGVVVLLPGAGQGPQLDGYVGVHLSKGFDALLIPTAADAAEGVPAQGGRAPLRRLRRPCLLRGRLGRHMRQERRQKLQGHPARTNVAIRDFSLFPPYGCDGKTRIISKGRRLRIRRFLSRALDNH